MGGGTADGGGDRVGDGAGSVGLLRVVGVSDEIGKTSGPAGSAGAGSADGWLKLHAARIKPITRNSTRNNRLGDLGLFGWFLVFKFGIYNICFVDLHLILGFTPFPNHRLLNLSPVLIDNIWGA